MTSISIDQLKKVSNKVHQETDNSNLYIVRDNVTLKMNGIDIDGFFEYVDGNYLFMTKKGDGLTAYDFLDNGCNIELETHFCKTELNNPLYNLYLYDLASRIVGGRFTTWVFEHFNVKYFHFRFFKFFILVP